MVLRRVTPESINSLEKNEVFCFGSNEGGNHWGGAAKLALKWGAKLGQGFGLQGWTFAVPTKAGGIGWIGDTLPLENIQVYIERFLDCTESRPDLRFLMTAIGCGLAGLTPEQVAPLFHRAVEMENVCLPESFWRVLEKS